MRRDLPSGTVTFLFTDVEGSTRLLHELGADSYATALAEHRRILRAAFGASGGVEVDTQGDAFFVAFPTAAGAVRAAASALEGLAPGPIWVRMGIHTGTPHLAEEGYVGVDVHRAARIAACGHGGQVLMSGETAALLGGEGLRDLGEHRLKDLSAPERVYQLGERDFPPLHSLHQTNLPIQSTPFLGRAAELAEVGRLQAAEDVRLLTLTGPGGTGKTRLALQAAGEAAARYPDGIWWVPLAALRDPELVLEAAAGALGAKDDLAAHIRDRSMLLLFDNFEQVVGAATDIAGLLAACPRLDLLVTSRERLHVSGEQEYPVPPLAHEESVRFFLARARAVKPDFESDGAVSEICRRLDELPLALELAATRVKALSSGQILRRLQQRLPLLTGGARDLPERQRTLRAAIEWSYELLSEEEQRLFARLAVFGGGCTLEAAEAVASADLDVLQSLVDKSLVRHSEERFWMLETIREYAAERLESSGEAEELRRRHAEHFLALAKRAASRLEGEHETEVLRQLDAEADNLRAALDWYGELRQTRELVRLVLSLQFYWTARGRDTEARRWLNVALADVTNMSVDVQATLLSSLARVVMTLGDYREGRHLNEAALAIREHSGDRFGIAESLALLGDGAYETADFAAAEDFYARAATLFATLGETRRVTRELASRGFAVRDSGDLDRAAPLLDEALARARLEGDPGVLAHALMMRGELAFMQGDLTRAALLIEESVALSRIRDSAWGLAVGLLNLAAIAQQRGDLDLAAAQCAEALRLVAKSDWHRFNVTGLVVAAGLIAERSRPEEAARLLGAIDPSQKLALGPFQLVVDRAWACVRSQLAPASLDAELARGRALSPNDALAEAMTALRVDPGAATPE